MNIHLHIDRLILDGLPVTATQGAVVQAAVESELARLLAASGVSPNLRGGDVIESLFGARLPLSEQITPSALGDQIAGAIGRTINRKIPCQEGRRFNL